MIGDSIAHYRILKKLGSGGMGAVYLAFDTKLERKVAIKVLRPDSAIDAKLQKRLFREAQAVAKLDHPNICAVYDVNDAGSFSYIVMQYIEGETLAEKMVRQPLETKAAIAIAEQVAEGLSEAHAQGIIHRDLKPQNLMITPRGQVKILDFGLSKQLHASDSVDPEAQTASLLSTPGHVVGTMPYMSPEQVQGEPIDERSDIFSLGVVLYEMLAGKHPFKDKSAAVTISRILLAEPIQTEQFSQVSPSLQALLSKMLAKDKKSRCESAKHLLVELRKAPAEMSAEILPAVSARHDASPAIKQNHLHRMLGFVSRHPGVIVASILAVVVLAFAISRLIATDRLESLAILPFTFESTDAQSANNPDRQYISDGLTESIISNLSQLANLKVIARSSVFRDRYRGKDRDAQAIGRELQVRAVLDGQVKQAGDELTIIVHLMDVQANREIWGNTYQRKTGDIQSVQKEIARNVSEQMHLNLTGAEKVHLEKNYTASGEAYEAYLKGRYHWNKRTKDGFESAVKFFQEAIDKDPNYALAYSGLADCYTLQSDYGFLGAKQGYTLAKGAVTLALKLDDSLAEAHTSLASIKAVLDWDWQGAENEYRRAIELDPKYATAHHWYAAQLLLQGRFDEALQEIKKAQQLDPLSLGINKDFAVILLYARDYDKALEQCRKTLEIEPGFGAMSIYMAQIYELKRKLPEAVAEVEKAHAADPKDSEITYALAQAYALSGRRDEALKLSNGLNQPGPDIVFLPKEAAYLDSLLGDKDRAVAILQKAADDHYLPVAEVKTDPRLDDLRKDARVAEILRKLGLSQ